MQRPAINVRLSEEHYKMLYSLTTDYKTLSSLVQDAVVLYLSQPSIMEAVKLAANTPHHD